MRSLFEGSGESENGGLETLMEVLRRITRFMDESSEVRQSLRFDVALWAEEPHASAVREVLLDNAKSATELFAEYGRKGQEQGKIKEDVLL